MKAHIATDAKSKLIHTVKTTTAKTHDSEAMNNLLHGEEKAVFADKAYANKEQKKKWKKDCKR